MKQFEKTVNKERPCFEYINLKMPEISINKLKVEIFNRHGTRQFIDKLDSFHWFLDFLSEVLVNSWSLLTLVVRNFVNNHKSEKRAEVVSYIINFKDLEHKGSLITQSLGHICAI